MARSRAAAGPKPRNDAYTMMLFITLVATAAGCVLLYLDYDEYGKEQPPKPDAVTVPALKDTAAAPPSGAATQAPLPTDNDKRNAQALPPDAVIPSRRVPDARPVSRVVNPSALLPFAIPTGTVPVSTTITPPEPPAPPAAPKPAAVPAVEIPAVVVPPVK